MSQTLHESYKRSAAARLSTSQAARAIQVMAGEDGVASHALRTQILESILERVSQPPTPKKWGLIGRTYRELCNKREIEFQDKGRLLRMWQR